MCPEPRKARPPAVPNFPSPTGRNPGIGDRESPAGIGMGRRAKREGTKRSRYRIPVREPSTSLTPTPMPKRQHPHQRPHHQRISSASRDSGISWDSLHAAGIAPPYGEGLRAGAAVASFPSRTPPYLDFSRFWRGGFREFREKPQGLRFCNPRRNAEGFKTAGRCFEILHDPGDPRPSKGQKSSLPAR